MIGMEFDNYNKKQFQMGCGTLCDSRPGDVIEPSKKKIDFISELVPQLKFSSLLPKPEAFQIFCEKIQSHGKEYILAPQHPIAVSSSPRSQILQKWLFIILGRNLTQSSYVNCLDLSIRQCQRHHSSIVQIQKDIGRTFAFTQSQSSVLERVLIRIASHFPTMGYTQGVNFIVGYLILLNYSQQQVFWVFVHLALNQNYLLLGLFQDGLPLTYVFCHIFRRALARQDPALHLHLFQTLQLDDSMWIFKWFITCFLYSLPIETVAYVWDLFIERGSLFLVSFAIALVCMLRTQLLLQQDPADVSEFLKQVKEISTFNQLINIKQLLKRVHTFEFKISDYQGIAQCNGGFYAEYFKQKACQNNVGCKVILQKWYDKLLEQRSVFNQVKKNNEQESIKKQMIESVKNKNTDEIKEREKSISKCMEELQKSFIQFSQSMVQSHRSIQRKSIIFEQIREVKEKKKEENNNYRDGSEESTKPSLKPVASTGNYFSRQNKAVVNSHIPVQTNNHAQSKLSSKIQRKFKYRNNLRVMDSVGQQMEINKKLNNNFVEEIDKANNLYNVTIQTPPKQFSPCKNKLITAAESILNVNLVNHNYTNNNTPQCPKTQSKMQSTPQPQLKRQRQKQKQKQKQKQQFTLKNLSIYKVHSEKQMQQTSNENIVTVENEMREQTRVPHMRKQKQTMFKQESLCDEIPIIQLGSIHLTSQISSICLISCSSESAEQIKAHSLTKSLAKVQNCCKNVAQNKSSERQVSRGNQAKQESVHSIREVKEVTNEAYFPERVFKKKHLQNLLHPYQYEESCESIIAASLSVISQKDAFAQQIEQFQSSRQNQNKTPQIVLRNLA